MAEELVNRFELYKLYLTTAERVSDRRAAANVWMLSVNSAIVAFQALVGGNPAWAWAMPVAGVLVCIAWANLLASYRQLNTAKFQVLHEIEVDFAIPMFQREEMHYRATGRWPLSSIELLIPLAFIALYLIVIVAALA